jgi:hypothetical protein
MSLDPWALLREAHEILQDEGRGGAWDCMDLANRIFTALEAHDESAAESERHSYENLALLVEAKSAELRIQDAHQEFMERLQQMTPAEQRQTLVDAEIITKAGDLTEPYAELEPPPTWHRYVNGSIRAYMNVGALSVWKFAMGKGYRWQIESDKCLPDPIGGVCATEEEAKDTAIKAARGQLPEDYDSFASMRDDDE